MGKSGCESAEVEPVAPSAPAFGEVAFEDRLETPLTMAHDRLALLGKLEAGREFAQQREQRQVRPWGRLEPMRFRLRDGDRPRATAACRADSSSRKPTFRFTIPLR